MAGRALLAGYPRYIQWANLQNFMYKYDIMHANFRQPITAYSWNSQKHEPGYGLTLSKIQVMIKIRKWSEAETCSLGWCNVKLATIGIKKSGDNGTDILIYEILVSSLQWRYNGRGGVSNHQRHDCLLNRLLGRRSKETSKLRVTGLCAENSPVPGEFPAQMVSNAENASIWWRHHVL